MSSLTSASGWAAGAGAGVGVGGIPWRGKHGFPVWR